QRHIPAELDGVAETLLAMNQDRLPGNRLAAPERLAEIAARANEWLLVPAPLVAGPAVLVIAGEELQQRLVPARLDVTGIDGVGAAVAVGGLGEAIELLQRQPAIVQRLGKIGPHCERGVIACQRLAEALELQQHVAA